MDSQTLTITLNMGKHHTAEDSTGMAGSQTCDSAGHSTKGSQNVPGNQENDPLTAESGTSVRCHGEPQQD